MLNTIQTYLPIQQHNVTSWKCKSSEQIPFTACDKVSESLKHVTLLLPSDNYNFYPNMNKQCECQDDYVITVDCDNADIITSNTISQAKGIVYFITAKTVILAKVET